MGELVEGGVKALGSKLGVGRFVLTAVAGRVGMVGIVGPG